MLCLGIGILSFFECLVVFLQVYLICFAAQWNARMESLRVANSRLDETSSFDPSLVQRLNRRTERLFGKEYVYRPNFIAPMPLPEAYDDPSHEELLGVEYVYCQSSHQSVVPATAMANIGPLDLSASAPVDYYAQKTAETENAADADEESGEEEPAEEEGTDAGYTSGDEATDAIHPVHVATTENAQVADEDSCSPAMQDVLFATARLHLPGYKEVEDLAVELVKILAGNRPGVPEKARKSITKAASKLLEHDTSHSKFIKNYRSKWGFALFGRCSGELSPENLKAQKIKFAAYGPYAQAALITQDSRLLYLVISQIQNTPHISGQSSPSKASQLILEKYKILTKKIIDDPVLCQLSLPLPKINQKSVTQYLSKQEKRVNLLATKMPLVKGKRYSISQEAMGAAPVLPAELPLPDRAQVQYEVMPHASGKRRGEKRRLVYEEDPLEGTSTSHKQQSASVPRKAPTPLPRLAPMPTRMAASPLLLVLPSQPQGPGMSFYPPTLSAPAAVSFRPPPPPPVKQKSSVYKSKKPCSACGLPQCGGKVKRYTITLKDGTRRRFNFCPPTGRSTSPGFDDVYASYEDFVDVVKEKFKSQT